jgi:nicotinamidase-related amidase
MMLLKGEDTMKTALVLVDLQNDYFPGGAMELSGMAAAGARAGELLAACRSRGFPIFHVQHLALRPGATFFRPGTPGAEIHQSVQPRPGETVIPKHFPNSFRETGLAELLRGAGIEELIICGAMSHMCIDATTRAAADLGFRCTVVHDACAARDLAFGDLVIPAAQVHGAFMAALAPIYARVLSLEEFLRTVTGA